MMTFLNDVCIIIWDLYFCNTWVCNTAFFKPLLLCGLGYVLLEKIDFCETSSFLPCMRKDNLKAGREMLVFYE